MTTGAGDSKNDSGARLREAFDALIDMDMLEREAWLVANIESPEQRETLLRLLAEDDARGFLDTSLVAHAARIEPGELKPDGLIGRQIGVFRIVRLLGQGGMAAVFLGERIGRDFEQHVAVKILRRGLYSALEQRLFLRERQVLAALSHPNIARMIDGGVTDAGIPYLVMEFVDGVPITRYVTTHALTVRQRTELFLTVCRAVEAAHRNLIVHRDIKPSNVLISADGVVKLLDFGIAKLIEEDNIDATGTVGVFTPNYAAPEQVRGGTITTATDVYGLGVMLHELLLGIRPEGVPTRRPSSRVMEALRITQPDASAPMRSMQLRSALRGDLDNILLKALAEEPELRYASAGAFADDIERYLKRRPVVAHPPSRWYRATKFVQRHRGGVALSAIFLLALMAAFGMTLWQAKVARNEAERANATRDFMVDLFQTASADLPRDERPTPQQLVEEAAKRAREDPDLVPDVRANLLFTLGKVALANGDYKQAELLLNDAIDRYRTLGVSPSSTEWLDLIVQKGNLLHRTDRNTEADALMTSVLPQMLAQESEPAVSGLMLLGATRAYAGHADEAVTIAQQAARKAEQVFGADSVNAVETLTYLGQLCVQVHRYRESIALLEPAIARWRKLQLPQDEEFARTLLHLAGAKERVGEVASVESLYREAIALMRRVFDKPHDRLATALGAYARFLTGRERFDEAKSALDEALAIDKKAIGNEHVRTALVLDAMAMLDHARHDDAAAEHSAGEAMRVLSAHAKDAGFDEELALVRLHLADILISLNRVDAASTQLDSIAKDVPRLFGQVSAENADFIRASARLALARNDAVTSLAETKRGTAIVAQTDLPVTETKIALLRVQAEASAVLGNFNAALTDVTQALDDLRATNADAHVQLTSLLALKARLESAAGQAVAANATIAEARSLGVPPALLSHEDALALNPTGL